MKKSEIVLGLMRIPLDYCFTVFSFVSAYFLRKNHPDILPWTNLSTNLEVFQPWPEYLRFSLLGAALLILIFAFNRQYTLKTNRHFAEEVGRVFLSTSFWLVLIIAYFFFARELFFSRLVLAYIFIFTLLLVSSGRLLLRVLEKALLRFNVGKRNILILGENKTAAVIRNQLGRDRRFNVIGFHNEKNFPLENRPDLPGLLTLIKREKIAEIIHTDANLQSGQAEKILDFCREHHLEYAFVPDLIDIHLQNIEVSPVAGIPLIHLRPTPLDGWGKILKRLFDLGLATIFLFLLSPLMLIVALAIKLDSKGTVMFKYLDSGTVATRIGQNGKPFRFFKFRSMHPNTHDLRYTKLAHLNTRSGTPLVKIKNDPRITRVGKLIRPTSIDELPQLLNVIRGEMSLVGPRAHLPEEVSLYGQHHKFILGIKPGITGLAQISGRSDLHFEDEVKLDRYYIENWSPWLDIKILIKTFFVVLARSGAKD